MLLPHPFHDYAIAHHYGGSRIPVVVKDRCDSKTAAIDRLSEDRRVAFASPVPAARVVGNILCCPAFLKKLEHFLLSHGACAAAVYDLYGFVKLHLVDDLVPLVITDI